MAKKNSTTRSVDRALDILESFLYEGKSLSLKEISESTELANSTVYRILTALKEKGFVEKNEDNKEYSPGFKIAELGKLCEIEIGKILKDVSKSLMIELSKRYNEDVRLFVREGNYKLCIESIESDRKLRHIMAVGDKHTLFKGAAGKVLLAFMSKEERSDMIKESEITEEDLEKVRDRGYALSLGEKEEGLVGIASPIFNINNQIVAAVSLSGPTTRFINETIDDKISDTIETAKEITKLYQNSTK